MRSGGLVIALLLAAATASAQPVLQGPVIPADGATVVRTTAPAPAADAGAWQARQDTPMLILLVTLAPFAFAFVVMAKRGRTAIARRRSLPRAIIARPR